MAAITEDYCSQEVYRRLREKGFDGEIHTTFDKEGYTQASITLQMAMKWLREVHKLHIEILASYHFRIFDGYSFEVYNIKDAEFVNYSSDKGTFKTYEEAAESSIKYCLENLI